MRQAKLTQGFVNKVKPEEKRIEYRDTELDGFELRVSPSGDKAFRYIYREGSGRDAKRRCVTIGKASEISADEARKLVKGHALRVSQGGNPAEERDQAQEEMRVSALWDVFLQDHLVAKGRSARTIEEYERLFRTRIAPTFGARRLSELTRPKITTWHQRAYRHPRAANHALALLSSMLSFAFKTGRLQGDNPCRGIEKYAEKSRESSYTPDEIAAFLKALEAEEDLALRAMFRLLIFTGARVNEVLRAERAEFDLRPGRGAWTLPPEKMKQRKRHTYPLSDAMVAYLKTYLEETPIAHTRWMFPGPGGQKPRNEIRHVLLRIEERAGIEHKPGRGTHGFRHTALTEMAEMGLSASDIQLAAGHADIQTSMKYVHRGADNPRIRDFVERRAEALGRE